MKLNLTVSIISVILLACFCRAGLLVKEPESIVYAPASDFTYVTNGNAITITSYTGSEAQVNIPPYIDGLPVGRISNIRKEAGWNYSITGVHVPDTVHAYGRNRPHCYNSNRRLSGPEGACQRSQGFRGRAVRLPGVYEVADGG